MLKPPAELVAAAKATITECSVQDVQRCLDADTLIIDVREPHEYRKAHIQGALHVPRGMLEFDIHGLVERQRADENLPPEQQAIVLYCGTGGRSALAAASLEDLGYRNVRSLAGGIIAWAKAGLPLAQP